MTPCFDCLAKTSPVLALNKFYFPSVKIDLDLNCNILDQVKKHGGETYWFHQSLAYENV